MEPTIFGIIDQAGQVHQVTAECCIVGDETLQFETLGAVNAVFFIRSVLGVSCFVSEPGRFVAPGDEEEDGEEEE